MKAPRRHPDIQPLPPLPIREGIAVTVHTTLADWARMTASPAILSQHSRLYAEVGAHLATAICGRTYRVESGRLHFPGLAESRLHSWIATGEGPGKEIADLASRWWPLTDPPRLIWEREAALIPIVCYVVAPHPLALPCGDALTEQLVTLAQLYFTRPALVGSVAVRWQT